MSTTPLVRKVWAVPILLVLLTLVGLLSALLGEREGWKVLAWALLAVPVLVGVWFACLKRRA